MGANGGTSSALWLALAALCVLFTLSQASLLRLPPGVDSLGFYWMVKELSPFALVTDPLSAGYTFVFYFEPVLVYLHYISLATVPWLGNPGHHLAGLLGAFAAAAVLAHMVKRTSGDPTLGLLGAGLFLFSSPAVFDVASTIMVHYLYVVLFSLLSLRPAWNEWLAGDRVRTTGVLESALWYGLAVGSKESAAALPLLIGALHLSSGVSLTVGAARLVPHGLVLLALLAWRVYILGGVGGYFNHDPFFPSNLIFAAQALFAPLWGSAYLIVPVAVWLLVRSPKRAALAAVAYIATTLPFVFAPTLFPGVQVGGRMILTWALLLLLIIPELRRLGAITRAAIAVAFLFLQAGQLEEVRRVAAAEVPSDWETPRAVANDETVVSPHALWYALEHQLRSEPKGDLHAFLYDLGLTLSGVLELTTEGGPHPKAADLDLRGLRFWADSGGRFHLRADAERLRPVDPSWPARLFAALQYDNGKTHWLIPLPVGRQRVDFPLNYSLRAIILFEVGDTEAWPIHVWHSPFFVDPYPPKHRG